MIRSASTAPSRMILPPPAPLKPARLLGLWPSCRNFGGSMDAHQRSIAHQAVSHLKTPVLLLAVAANLGHVTPLLASEVSERQRIVRSGAPPPQPAMRSGTHVGGIDRWCHVGAIVDLEMATDGTHMFALVRTEPTPGSLKLFESRNAGQTWLEVRTFSGAGGGDVAIGEGSLPQVFVAWVNEGPVSKVAHVDSRALDFGAWSSIDVGAVLAQSTQTPVAITTDAYDFDEYYVYLLLGGLESAAPEAGALVFAQSLDLGTTWSPSVNINLPAGELEVVDVAFDYNESSGAVHAAYLANEPVFGTLARYARGTFWGDKWAPVQTIGLVGTNTRERDLALLALGSSVQYFYEQEQLFDDAYLAQSTDDGLTWGSPALVAPSISGSGENHSALARTPDRTQLALLRHNDSANATTLQTASSTLPIAFGSEITFADANTLGATDVALAGSDFHGNRWAFGFGRTRLGEAWVHVDAEWYADPWYAQIPYGFPAAGGGANPALVDLDSDGDLEIVSTTVSFGSSGIDSVYVHHHDGTRGWAQPAGVGVLDASVADLDGDGENDIIVGNRDGSVHAFRRDGTLLPGWPVSVDNSGVIHTSHALVARHLDTTGAAYVVATGLNKVVVLDAGGVEVDAFATGWNDSAREPAIADMDGDGTNEIILSSASFTMGRIGIRKMGGSGWFAERSLPSLLLVAPIVGDVNNDGQTEVLAGLEGGQVLALDQSLNALPGWSFNEEIEIGGLAAANVLGDDKEEILVTNVLTIYLLDHTGTAVPGYPPTPAPMGQAFDQPLLATIDPSQAPFTIQRRSGSLWMWTNDGSGFPGWPVRTGAGDYGAAVGDIDNDSIVEIVTSDRNSTTVVFKVNPVGGSRPGSAAVPFGGEVDAWPMVGGTLDRHNCFDCSSVSTGISAVPAPPRVSKLVIFPNPTPARARAAFSIAAEARVRLALYNASGRLVRVLADGQRAAGEHAVFFSPRDATGGGIANGTYFVTLQVGGQRTRTQRLVVTR